MHNGGAIAQQRSSNISGRLVGNRGTTAQHSGYSILEQGGYCTTGTLLHSNTTRWLLHLRETPRCTAPRLLHNEDAIAQQFCCNISGRPVDNRDTIAQQGGPSILDQGGYCTNREATAQPRHHCTPQLTGYCTSGRLLHNKKITAQQSCCWRPGVEIRIQRVKTKRDTWFVFVFDLQIKRSCWFLLFAVPKITTTMRISVKITVGSSLPT